MSPRFSRCLQHVKNDHKIYPNVQVSSNPPCAPPYAPLWGLSRQPMTHRTITLTTELRGRTKNWLSNNEGWREQYRMGLRMTPRSAELILMFQVACEMGNAGYSSAGRASDCRSLQQLDGPWVDSGWPASSRRSLRARHEATLPTLLAYA